MFTRTIPRHVFGDGPPNVTLTNCSIRSDTSLDCNGHDGNVAKSYASGTVAGCGHPSSNAAVVPDTFLDLAKNIVNDALLFDLRIDTEKPPADLLRAYTAIELKAISKHNPSGFASQASATSSISARRMSCTSG